MKGVVLQLINLDTVGPFPASRDGKKYCCAIVDDSSGYVEPAISKTVGGVAPIIVRKLRVLQYARKMHVDTIQTDGAGELCKGVIKQWAEAQGTTITTTIPNHSSANGLAERTVRTLQETATTALAHARMSDTYWDYAVEDAALKHNVLPTARNAAYAAPAEIVFGKPVPVSHFHTFRQYGYMTNVKRQEPAPSPSDFMPILAGSQRTQVQRGSSTHKPSRNLSPRGILTSAPSSTGATRTPTL
jgi:hypothetical protein